MRRKVITQKVWIGVGYAFDTISSTKGTTRLFSATTFVLYNGAEIKLDYSNGQPGNKPGWKGKEAK